MSKASREIVFMQYPQRSRTCFKLWQHVAIDRK